MELKLGIVGSRKRNSLKDFHLLKEFILKAKEKFNITIISGGCQTGADHFAEMIAEELKIPIILFLPDKSKLPEKPQKYHFRQINFDRNTLIAEACEVLVALTIPEGSNGTDDTIEKTKKLNKKVILL